MHIREVVIGTGILAAAIAHGQYPAQAAARQPLRPIAAHRPAANDAAALPQAGQRSPGKPAAKPATGRGRTGAAAGPTVRNLTPQQIFDYQMASTDPGNPAAGRPLFEKTCAKCHKFGSIGNSAAGPDLSTSKSRLKKKDILESILWPSKVVTDQYQTVVIETKDGQSHTGIVEREDKSSVVLRTAEDPEHALVIPKANMSDRRVSNQSIMPEDVFKDFTQQDVTNLVAFLLSTPPV
jgi:putative heme-binding domain-containing protein